MLRKWIRKRAERRLFSSKSREEVFDWIHRTNKWGSSESVSGKGSELRRTAAIRRKLPELIRELRVGSILDIPCGDLNWLERIDLPVEYTGADIVAELVERNRQRYPEFKFLVLDACKDPLPDAELILMRDFLVHLSFADIRLVTRNLRGCEATYLACTTYPDLDINEDKLTGNHHRLNMQVAPFAWPAPSFLLDEEEKHGKALGVWPLAELQRTAWFEDA